MEGSSEKNLTSCDIYDGKEYAYVAMVSAVAGFLSLLAACCVIFIMVFLKKWPFFSQRLILYLAIATILTSLATILHRVDYDNQTTSFYVIACQLGGFLEQVTSWIFLNANSCITFYLFANVVLRVKTERFEVLYILFIFVFPFTFNWIPFIHNSYGRSGAWCWIRSKERVMCEDYELGQIFIFVLWFGPLYLTLFLLLVTYILITCKLYRTSKQWTTTTATNNTAKEFQKTVKHDILPLMAYPIVYLLLSITPTINRIQGLLYPESPILALWYISALSFPLEGGIIALAYTFDPDTRKRLTWKHAQGFFKSLTEKTQLVQEYPIQHVMDASFTREQGEKKEPTPHTKYSDTSDTPIHTV